MKKTIVHGTCIALGNSAALLRGTCGSGKSDLALRFLFLPSERLAASPALIADDQVILRRDGDRVIASCPQAIAGKIEVRGCGIARLPVIARAAELHLVVDLDWTGDRPRFPEGNEWETVLDVPIRRLVLDPFEPAAPIKLALALQDCFESPVD